MKEITILSGKGGTGKTSIAAAFASLSSRAIFCDNDVDAANLHLVMQPEITEEFTFASGDKAVIDADKCTGCGLCISHCRFEAIRTDSDGLPYINALNCEGCQLCMRICPEEAIVITHFNNNRWYISDTRFGKLIHARMGAGEENSGKLVTRLREAAKSIAEENSADIIISDGPPGIGCPVIASLTGTGAVLLVVEPSLSGLHDALRLSDLAHSFNLPLYVIINKYDINLKITARAEQFFKEKNVPVLGKIPFDTRLVKSMLLEMSIIEYDPHSKSSNAIRDIWKKLLQLTKTIESIPSK
jgi:MinD superfamily P-loop ATPase